MLRSHPMWPGKMSSRRGSHSDVGMVGGVIVAIADVALVTLAIVGGATVVLGTVIVGLGIFSAVLLGWIPLPRSRGRGKN